MSADLIPQVCLGAAGLAACAVPLWMLRRHDALLHAPWRMPDSEALRLWEGTEGIPFARIGSSALRLRGNGSVLAVGGEEDGLKWLADVIADGHTGGVGIPAPLLLIDAGGKTAAATKASRAAMGRRVAEWDLSASGGGGAAVLGWEPLADLAGLVDPMLRTEASKALAEALGRTGRATLRPQGAAAWDFLAARIDMELASPDPRLARCLDLADGGSDGFGAFARKCAAAGGANAARALDRFGSEAAAAGWDLRARGLASALSESLSFLEEGRLAGIGEARNARAFSLQEVLDGRADLVVSATEGAETDRPQVARAAVSVLCSLAKAGPGPDPLIALPHAAGLGWMRELTHNSHQPRARARIAAWVRERKSGRELMGESGWEAFEHGADVRLTLRGVLVEDAAWEEGMVEQNLGKEAMARLDRGHAAILGHERKPAIARVF